MVVTESWSKECSKCTLWAPPRHLFQIPFISNSLPWWLVESGLLNSCSQPFPLEANTYGIIAHARWYVGTAGIPFLRLYNFLEELYFILIILVAGAVHLWASDFKYTSHFRACTPSLLQEYRKAKGQNLKELSELSFNLDKSRNLGTPQE